MHQAVHVQRAAVGAIQEPRQGSALNRPANAVPESPARFSVLPPEQADLTRPPPPPPAWDGTYRRRRYTREFSTTVPTFN